MSGVSERWTEFKDLSQALRAAEDETARLQLTVDAAPSLIPGCDHAGVTLNEKSGLFTLVSSDEAVREANQLQHKLGEGPCVNLPREEDTFVIADLASDDRWPQWSATVHERLGVSAMMSILVHTSERFYGALSIYAGGGRRFDADDLAIAEGLAAHLAAIMAAGREVDQLGTALVSRLVIGRAEGILMERLGLTDVQSMDYLRRVSSRSNRKLIDVADEIARTRELPETR